MISDLLELLQLGHLSFLGTKFLPDLAYSMLSLRVAPSGPHEHFMMG